MRHPCCPRFIKPDARIVLNRNPLFYFVVVRKVTKGVRETRVGGGFHSFVIFLFVVTSSCKTTVLHAEGGFSEPNWRIVRAGSGRKTVSISPQITMNTLAQNGFIGLHDHNIWSSVPIAPHCLQQR